MRRYLSLATQQEVHDSTQLALTAHGNALLAVLSGFFTAAGGHPGVLFSPVSLLVGGLGSGTFAYDGRARQPGREVKRPRGFEGAPPLVSQIAVPGSIAALAVACAFHPGTSLLAASRPGVSAAKSAGARQRAAMIDAVAGLGARFLSEPRLKRELLARFGPAEQGNWGTADLVAASDIQRVPLPSVTGEGESLTLPWQVDGASKDADVEGATRRAWGRAQNIVAVDASGLFVALSYRELPDLGHLEEFELSLPAFAVPVLRGVPRVTPGEALPTPADLYLDRDESGAICAARALAASDGPALRIVRDAATKEAFAG
jgi:hypothetical protein